MNAKLVRQVLSFDGLRYGGGKCPTDIDGFLDWGGKEFVFIEAKYIGFALPKGQKIAYENLCGACLAAGVKSIVLVAEHTDKDPEVVIDCAALPVREMWPGYKKDDKSRTRRVWRAPLRPVTVREAIDLFLGLTKEGDTDAEEEGTEDKQTGSVR